MPIDFRRRPDGLWSIYFSENGRVSGLGRKAILIGIVGIAAVVLDVVFIYRSVRFGTPTPIDMSAQALALVTLLYAQLLYWGRVLRSTRRDRNVNALQTATRLVRHPSRLQARVWLAFLGAAAVLAGLELADDVRFGHVPRLWLSAIAFVFLAFLFCSLARLVRMVPTSGSDPGNSERPSFTLGTATDTEESTHGADE